MFPMLGPGLSRGRVGTGGQPHEVPVSHGFCGGGGEDMGPVEQREAGPGPGRVGLRAPILGSPGPGECGGTVW